MDKTSAHHLNSGTISLSGGDLFLSQSSGSSFTTTGTITIAANRTFSVSGGTFNYNGGTISGAGTLSLGGAIANFTPDFSNAQTTLLLNNATVNGPGKVTNVASLTLIAGTINAPLVNQGLLLVRNNSAIGGSFQNQAGATLRVQGDGDCCAAFITFATGFTNNGVIELTCINNPTLASLTVDSGTLVNAPGGQINVLAAAGGGRTLRAELNNQGALNVDFVLTMDKTSAHHLNSGTISLSGGDLFLSQSSGSSFTTTGTITIAANRTFSVNGGTFNYSGGTISGAGTFSLGGAIANFTPDFSNAQTTLLLNNATVNGPGKVTNVASLTLIAGTINAPLVNQGLLLVRNNSAIGGSFQNQPGATLRVQGDGDCCAAFITFATGFTNNGVIELTCINNPTLASLTVDSGTLVNAPGGQINVLAAAGGGRTINAGVDNQGTLTVGFNLTLNPGSGQILNSGTVQAQFGTLTISGPYKQTGGLTLLAGGSIANSQPLQLVSGILGGTGTVSGSVSNNATISPGASPGLLTISGDLIQTANSLMLIELAGTTPGTTFDKVAVGGTATLAGTLTTTLTNSFYPAVNASFIFLTCGTRNNTFSTFNFPSNDIGMTVNYSPTTATIQVINVRPVLPVFANRTNDELVLLSLDASGTDDDVPAQMLTYGLTNSPDGASINPSSGLLTWTPIEAQGPMTTNITVKVTDNGTPNLTVSRTFQVVVNEINVPPVLTLPSDQAINELAPFNANATATDSDIPANTLTFALVSGPPGLSVSPSGAISWLPSETQGPGTNLVTISVTDTNPAAVNTKSFIVTQSFTLIVNEVNTAPVLTVPLTQTLDELTTLTVTNTATDSDMPANPLTFSLVSGPAGATLNPTTGVLTWAPTEAQGPSTNRITVRVTDNNPQAVNSQQLSDARSFTVIVNEVNVAPVLTLPANTTIDEQTLYAATATATDIDDPANALIFALVSGPTGLAVSPSGSIAWTPTEAQGPSTNLVTISVTDTNPPAVNAKSISVTNSYTIVVNEVNVAPALTVPPSTNINEQTLYSANATATDADDPPNALTFTLVSGPSGLTVSPNGGISWTPTETQGPSTNVVTISVTDTNPAAVNAKSFSITNSYTIVVNEVNLPPILSLPSNTNIDEQTLYTASASATDADDPPNAITFALVSGPSGLTISLSGEIVWSPTEAQGPSTNLVVISVSDTNPAAVNEKSLSVTNSYTIIINEINRTPVLTLPPTTTISEQAPYSATATAADSDLPANPLTFALVSGPPGLIVSASGGISWTPGEASGPSTNTVTISVTDTNPTAINAKSLGATNSYTLIVTESNLPPVLTVPADQILHATELLLTNATATDPDIPANVLTFGLVSGPAGLTVTGSGVISWTPPDSFAETTNAVLVRVCDDGSPSLCATQLFNIRVVSRPILEAPAPFYSGGVVLSWSSIPGKRYRLQFNGKVAEGIWSNFVPDVTADDISTGAIDGATNLLQRFYRVQVVP
jgi:hypothetical protein